MSTMNDAINEVLTTLHNGQLGGTQHEGLLEKFAACQEAHKQGVPASEHRRVAQDYLKLAYELVGPSDQYGPGGLSVTGLAIERAIEEVGPAISEPAQEPEIDAADAGDERSPSL